MLQKTRQLLQNLLADSGFNSLMRGGGLVFFIKVLGALSAYIFALVAGRMFGAGAYGVFELCLTFLMILGTFGRLGLEGVWVRFLPEFFVKKQPWQFRQIARKTIVFSLITTGIVGALLVFFADEIAGFFSSEGLAPALVFTGIALPLYTLVTLLSEGFRAFKDMGRFSLFQNGTVTLLAALLLLPGALIAVPERSYPTFVFAIALFIVTLWSGYSFYRKMKRNIPVKEAHETNIPFRSLLKISIPMMISGTLFYFLTWTDTLMLGYFQSDEDVGVYRVAFRVATLITFAQFAINAVAAPMISEFYAANDLDGLRKFVRQIGWINFLVSTPIFLGLVIFGPQALALFGGAFDGGLLVLVVMALAQWVNALCGPVLYLLNMTGKEKIAQKIITVASVVNLILNFVLIPLYGILGAAVASGISMMLWNIAAMIAVFRYYKIVSFPFFK